MLGAVGLNERERERERELSTSEIPHFGFAVVWEERILSRLRNFCATAKKLCELLVSNVPWCKFIIPVL
jgi:hypothetical protein